MRQRIRNYVYIDVESEAAAAEVDLTSFSDLRVYVNQKESYFSETFVPIVTGETEMYIEIPFEKAMRLSGGRVKIQLAYTDGDGIQDASDWVYADVGELISDEGYNPVSD